MGKSKQTMGFWILFVCLVGILLLTVREYVINGELWLPQLAIVFALSPGLFKEIPSLANLTFLKPLMLTLAILTLGLEFF